MLEKWEYELCLKSNGAKFDCIYTKKYQQLQCQISIITWTINNNFILYLFSIVVVDECSYKFGRTMHRMTSDKICMRRREY